MSPSDPPHPHVPVSSADTNAPTGEPGAPACTPPGDSPSPSATRRYRFSASRRLSGKLTYQAVYDAKARKNVGFLSAWARPNDLPHCRLGLSVGKRVGNAPRRQHVKRMIREAFRLSQHDWPRGYDLIVAVSPHPSVSLAEYQRLLFAAVRGLHQLWDKRLRNQ